MSIEPEWVIAKRLCTPAELRTLEARERLSRNGCQAGYRSIADELGLSWSTVRDQLRTAEARIKRAQAQAEAKEAADG